MRRVVITGIGAVSCLGCNEEEITDSLKNGKSGIVFDDQRKDYGFYSPLTGYIDDAKVDAYLKDHLKRKQRKSMDTPAKYGYVAAEKAIADSNIDRDRLKNFDTGIIFGNDSVSGANVDMWNTLLENKETKYLGSGAIFKIMNSTITMNLSTIFGTKGACWTLSAACASGSHSIGQASELIRSGKQEIVIAGGAQEVNLYSMAAFDALQAFSKRLTEPTKGSRPFDKDRDGLVPSGGGAAVVLEEYEAAKSRGANIYGEILSYAFSSDGADLTVATGEGAEYALRKSLKYAGLSPMDIDYINAHATSTPVGDAAEALAIRNVFADKVPVSSTKSMTGHECWMSGASEIVYSLLMHKHGFIAPNINFEEPDEKTAGIQVINKTIYKKPEIILSNSFGFGGTNSVIIIKGMM